MCVQPTSRSRASFGPRFHRRLEETAGAKTLRLGGVKRQIGFLQQRVGFTTVGRRGSEADAANDRNVVMSDVEGVHKSIKKLASQDHRVDQLHRIDLHDGKLVAAQPRDHIAAARAAPHVLGHLLEQSIAT